MELTDCLCINCEEMIHPELFQIHSKVCFKVANHVKRLEEFDDTTIIDYKIDKLKSALEINLDSKRFEHLALGSYFRTLISIASELLLLTETSENDFSECNDKLKQLSGFSHIKEFQFVVYLERLKHLGLAKAELILTRVNPKERFYLNEELSKQNQELETLKEQLVYYKQRAEFMQGLKNQQIDDVRSDTEQSNYSFLSMSKDSSISSISSFFEEEGIRVNELEDDTIVQKVIPRDNSEEGLKRYFYSQCIVIKLSLGKNYRKNVSIAELYKVRDI